MRKRFIAAIMLIILVSTSVAALAQSKVSVNSTAVTQGLKDMMNPSGKFSSVKMADGTSFSTVPTTGIGDVVGPVSSVDNRVVFFDGLTGKLIKDSGLLLSGTNTGDNATNSQYSSLVSNATHTGDVLGGTSTTVIGINGTLMSGLATGIVKNTTTTGVPSIATQTGTGNVVMDTSAVLNTPEISGGITTIAGDGQPFEIGGYINSPFLQAGEYQNYLLYSESFNQSVWVKTLIGTVTANSTVSPLGTTAAENIPAGSGSTASISQIITNSATGDWTFSVWLKVQAGTSTIRLSIDSSAETGTVKNINLTTTWRRYFVTQSFVSENTTKTVFVVSGTNAIAAWGAQLEPSTYPRRYNGYDTGITAITTLTRNVYSPIQISASGGMLSTNTSTITRSAIATTSTEGIVNQNTTAATSGIPVQMSPRLRFSGTAWETTDGTSKTVNGIVEVLPTTGASASASMDFSIDPGTGSYTKYMSLFPTVLKIPSSNLDLNNTTNANQFGIITKNGTRFVHNFNYGNNGTVTTSGFNIFVGENAGNLTMGSTATQTYEGSDNTAIGYRSLISNTLGYRNIAIGSDSLRYNTTGAQNIASGINSMLSNTTGNSNVANGFDSMLSNTTGNSNTANGMFSLFSNTTGSSNTALGYRAGYNSGVALETNTNSIFIGDNANSSVNGLTNAIAIGSSAQVTQSNQVVLGNSSITQTLLRGDVAIGTSTPSAQLHTTGTVRFQNFGAGAATFDANGNVSSASDERFKIIDGNFTVGLSQVMGLQPISYHWNAASGLDRDNQYTGFSAQNVRMYIPEASSVDSWGYYNLQDRAIEAALVNSVKELAAEVDAIRMELNLLAVSRKALDRTQEKAVVVKSKVAYLEKQCDIGEIVTEEKAVAELVTEIIDGVEVTKEIATVKTVLKEGVNERGGKFYRIETTDEAASRYNLISQE